MLTLVMAVAVAASAVIIAIIETCDNDDVTVITLTCRQGVLYEMW